MDRKRYEIGHYLFEDVYKVPAEEKTREAVWFEGRSYTYGQIEESVDYYAFHLSACGVKKGDHVALLGVNSFNWLVAFYAIVRIGAVAVLLNYLARHETLVGLLKETDCAYLCAGFYAASGKREGELDDLLKESGIGEERFFSLRETDLDFKKILEKETVSPFPSPFTREEDSKRTSFIIFTTGTTSKPKAAMLSQYGMMNVIYLSLAPLDPVCPSKFMCLLPLFHCFGLLVVNGYLAFRRTVYLNTLLDKARIYRELLRNKCGDYASVSVVFDALGRTPFWWFHARRFVKHCIVGGGFTSHQELSFLERRYGKDKFLNGYGQTECSPLISLVYPDAPAEKRKTTVGIPIEGIELAFLDPTSGKRLPAGKSGEILVRGYNVFNGYYKVETKDQPIDADGFLHTGDTGYLDEDGYLVFTGRIKDIIIRKGENISPKEIEEDIGRYPEFGGVRVLGFPSVDEGEYIIACVELKKKPFHFSERKYLDDMHTRLPNIKIPAHIVYVKEFPRTANGKLDEMELREICMMKIAKYLDDETLAKKTRKLMAEASRKRN